MKGKFEILELGNIVKLERETMRQIVFYAFMKSQRESLKTTKTALASHISEVIERDFNEYICIRTLVRYYDEFISQKGGQKNRDRKILNILSKYIGCEDFIDFYRKYIEADKKD